MKNKKFIKQFKLPKRKQPVWKIMREIINSLLFGKFEIINLAGEIENACILVGNHAGKNGPVAYEKNLPNFHATWGAHEMLGSYIMRYKYLRNVLYIRKYKKGKFYATVKSLFEAIFSLMIYKGLKIIGTYPDTRMTQTLKHSANVLNSGTGILIFPEDSNSGYFDEPTKFFGGFSVLSEYYYNKTGKDLPVYPVYIHLKSKKLIIGNPKKVNELKQKGLSRDDICEVFRADVNNLYKEYVLNKGN